MGPVGVMTSTPTTLMSFRLKLGKKWQQLFLHRTIATPPYLELVLSSFMIQNSGTKTLTSGFRWVSVIIAISMLCSLRKSTNSRVLL